MNKTANKKIKFWGSIGECNVTPIGSPDESTQWRQVVDVCLIATDPTGSILANAIRKAGTPENVPNYLIKRMLDKLFGIWDFDSHGLSIVECMQNDGEQTFHLHTYGSTASFDLETWNDEFMLDEILAECKITKHDPS